MYIRHELTAIFSVTHLVNAAYYRLPVDYSEPVEKHDFWEVVYVDRGETVIGADDKSYLLKTGEMAFHRPNENHSVRPASGHPADIIVIAFVCNSPRMAAFEQRIIQLGPEEKQCLSNIVREAEATYVFFENNPPAVRLIQREDAAAGSEQIIRCSLEQLLIYVLRRDGKIHVSTRLMASNSTNHHALLADRVKEYLHAHYGERVTLRDVAAQQNISVSQLKAVFREQAGASVIGYLTDLRIREAKRMIRENQYNFTQIADAVGFESIYYFSARFKRLTGMTPTEYARSLRQ